MRRKISVNFAWDIWCIGAFWFGIGKEKRLHIFPFPFVVICIEFVGDKE